MKKTIYSILILSNILLANDFLNDISFNSQNRNLDLNNIKVDKNNIDSKPVVDPTLEKGIEAFNKKDYQTAGDIFAALMLEGDKRGAPYLGRIFGEGLGVEKDCQKGVFFTFTGLKENVCESNKVLADWYKTGNCAKINIEKSEKYLNFYNKCSK